MFSLTHLMLEMAGYNENCSVSYPGLLDPVTRQIEALAVQPFRKA